jgi:hypothetical protein
MGVETQLGNADPTPSLQNSPSISLHVLLLLATASGSLSLLGLQTVVKHLDSHVDVTGLASDGDQALVGVGRLTWARGGARLGNANLAVGLRANLVDLDASLADNFGCQSSSTSF